MSEADVSIETWYISYHDKNISVIWRGSKEMKISQDITQTAVDMLQDEHWISEQNFSDKLKVILVQRIMEGLRKTIKNFR